MNNLIFTTPTLSDKAIISGTAGFGDNSLANLQTKSLAKIYRSGQVCDIEIDFGVATEIDFISLIKHNGTGTVRVRAGSTDTYGDYDSGALNLITGGNVGYDNNLFAIKIAAQTYRYWRLEVVNSGLDYFQAGRIYLSKAFQPRINASYGYQEGFIDNSRKNRTISGDEVSTKRTPLKMVDFTMNFLSSEEMYGSLYDIEKTRGATKDVLIIRDIEETTYFQKQYIYGTIDELNTVTIASFGVFQKGYKITELP
jgi:hypothetical protein